MNYMGLTGTNGAVINIGYRTPGLSSTHKPEEKMALAHSPGISVVEPQFVAREFNDRIQHV